MSDQGPKVFCARSELENHTSEGKGREKKKERSRRKKGGEEKKAVDAVLVLIMATLEIVFGRKKKKKLYDGRDLFDGNAFKYPARYTKCTVPEL